MLSAGATIELRPDKAVVGGRMLARAEGEVVLVSGAIPGERVSARLDRRQQGVWFATTVDVLDPSPDRQDPGPDPGCGGMALAHIAYGRQCELKASIVGDALARIGRVVREAPIPLTAAAPTGYRARYRVHAGLGMLGFFREGTHEVCDPAASGQLAPASLRCLREMAGRIGSDLAAGVEAFEWLENLSNTERVVNVALRRDGRPAAALLASVADTPGVTGVSWTAPGRSGPVAAAGQPWVSDPVAAFLDASAIRGTGAEPRPSGDVALRRHAPAFFQANRFLTPALASKVVGLLAEGPAIDLYAGVGLFAVCAAAAGLGPVTAIEGDPVSAEDLRHNAAPWGRQLQVVHASVEDYLGRTPAARAATIIVDPPRSGMSRAALQRIIAARARRLVYVSCDVATLARDTRRLLDAGYALCHLEALDLFPNTPHVEGLAAFDGSGATTTPALSGGRP